MTLDTRVFALDQVNIGELFAEALAQARGSSGSRLDGEVRYTFTPCSPSPKRKIDQECGVDASSKSSTSSFSKPTAGKAPVISVENGTHTSSSIT